MLWPFTTREHTRCKPFWLQILSSDREGVIHSPACFSMKTTSWAGAIRTKLIASSGLALVWSTPVLASVKGCWRGLVVNLHAPIPFAKLVKVTLGGIFVKAFCYTSGNHGSIWANFCSPSKTTKLLQISIGVPERASKKCRYWKSQLSTWTLTNF